MAAGCESTRRSFAFGSSHHVTEAPEMAKIELPLTGTCHCGGLTYEIAARPVCCAVCHCTNCQRISGSAFACNIVVPEAGFRITGGEIGRVEWTADSGRSRWGDFCATCGSRIVHGSTPSTGMLIVRAGTLDDRSWLRPMAHIWTRSAQPWVDFGDIPAYEKSPEDWKPLFARFEQLGLFA
jgi:hypothetical protein